MFAQATARQRIRREGYRRVGSGEMPRAQETTNPAFALGDIIPCPCGMVLTDPIVGMVIGMTGTIVKKRVDQGYGHSKVPDDHKGKPAVFSVIFQTRQHGEITPYSAEALNA